MAQETSQETSQKNTDLTNAIGAGKYVVPSSVLAGALTVLINEFVQVLSPDAMIALPIILIPIINIAAYVVRKRLQK